MKAFLARFARSTSGVTAIEYGLIAAMVSVLIIGSLAVIGPTLVGFFTSVTDGLTGGVSTGPPPSGG